MLRRTFGLLCDEITVHSVAEDVLADHLELVDGARLEIVDLRPGAHRRIHIHRNPIVDARLSVPEPRGQSAH